MSSQGSRYTEGWLPVKGITNGMVILDNNLKVAGVKIIPKNNKVRDEQYDSKQKFFKKRKMKRK